MNETRKMQVDEQETKRQPRPTFIFTFHTTFKTVCGFSEYILVYLSMDEL
jgi:hypothetical protein